MIGVEVLMGGRDHAVTDREDADASRFVAAAATRQGALSPCASAKSLVAVSIRMKARLRGSSGVRWWSCQVPDISRSPIGGRGASWARSMAGEPTAGWFRMAVSLLSVEFIFRSLLSSLIFWEKPGTGTHGAGKTCFP